MTTPGHDPRTPLLPATLAAFETSIAAGARGRRPRHRRLRRGAALGVFLALVGGTALAATGQWQPFGSADTDRYTFADAPAEQTASLAVLRRTQSARDRGPLMTAFLERFLAGPSLPGPSSQVYLRYVRELRPVESGPVRSGGPSTRASGGVLVLIPSEVGDAVSGTRTNRKLLPGLPLCVYVIEDAWASNGGRHPFADARSASSNAQQTPPPELRDRITGSGTCGTLDDIRRKGLQMGAFNYGAVTGIVPDGVATVRATTRDGQAISSRVVNNSFQLLAPGRHDGPDPAANGADRPDLPPPSGQIRHQSVEWLDADGRAIRRLPQ